MVDRKAQILDVATELVQTRGYSAFSYQDLSNRLGITKASLHHHFASKEKLGIAVAEKYNHDVKAFLKSVTRTHDDPWDQFRAYLDFVIDIMHSQDRICAAGSVQSEINVVPAAMGKSICALVEFVIDWIAGVIAEGRNLGVMEFPGTPQDQAAMIFAAAQGAMQYGRAQGVKKSQSVMKQIAEGLKPKP